MDSDRILVVDAGKIVEFDHPYLLLKQPEGFLHGLVMQTGSETSNMLYKIAKKVREHEITIERTLFGCFFKKKKKKLCRGYVRI